MSTKVFHAVFAAAGFLGAAVPMALAFPGGAAPGLFSAASAEDSSTAAPALRLAGRAGQGRVDQRGSSAEVYGGSSADRYGGSSADRHGVAGERDVRVHGRPKRPPKEKEPKKPVEGDQQDDEQVR